MVTRNFNQKEYLNAFSFWEFVRIELWFNWSIHAKGINVYKTSCRLVWATGTHSFKLHEYHFWLFPFDVKSMIIHPLYTRAARTNFKYEWTFWPHTVGHIQLKEPKPHKKIPFIWASSNFIVVKIINSNPSQFLFIWILPFNEWKARIKFTWYFIAIEPISFWTFRKEVLRKHFILFNSLENFFVFFLFSLFFSSSYKVFFYILSVFSTVILWKTLKKNQSVDKNEKQNESIFFFAA